jgi:cobalt-zinc-cadmium efflux system protein
MHSHPDEEHSQERHSHEQQSHERHGAAAPQGSRLALSGRKILGVTLLNLLITAAEVVGGILSGSLALLSDSLHNLSDTAAISMSYVAYRWGQKPRNARKTFGYKRAEILAAFTNAAVLIGVSVFLIIEAVRRWRQPEDIKGGLMITVAVIGLAANLLSVLLLHRDARGSLNIRSSYLHLLGDTVSSIGVVLGGIVIRIWGAVWVDPLVTVLISLYIIKKAAEILKKTFAILMQGSADLDYEQIRRDIEAIGHVRNIHHIHSWMVNEQTVHFEAHLDMDDMSLCEAQAVYDQIEQLLRERHGVTHVTLQAEVDKCANKEMF